MSKVYIIKNPRTDQLEAHSTFNEAYKASGWGPTQGILEMELKKRKRRSFKPVTSGHHLGIGTAVVKAEGEPIGFDS